MNNENVLKTISHKNNTAVAVFTDWAMRQRHRGAIDIVKSKRALRKGGDAIDDQDYLQVLTDLQAAGYGKVIKDHRGNPRHFLFNHPVYEIGKAAIEDKPIKSLNQAPKPEPARRVKIAPKPKSVQTAKTVVYCVVEGRKIKMEVDGNIPDEVLERILSTLKNKGGNT